MIKYISTSLTPPELRQVANLHTASLNTSFLSQLGSKFLFYLYKSINECEEAELIIAKDGDNVIGFITGTNSLRPIYKHLLKRYFLQVAASLFPNLKPRNIKKIIEILKHTQTGESLSKNSSNAELLSIAVNRKYRGKGISKNLFNILSLNFKNKGYNSFKIIAGVNLIAAKKFYRKMGAIEIDSTTIHTGEKSLVFKIDI